MLFVFVHFRKGCYHSACLYVDGLFSIVIAFCAELAWLVVSITPSLAVLSLTLHLENCLVLYPGPPWLIQSGGWGNLFNINDLLGNILLQFGTPNEWMPWLEQIVVLPTSRSCSQEFGWAFGLSIWFGLSQRLLTDLGNHLQLPGLLCTTLSSSYVSLCSWQPFFLLSFATEICDT